MTKVGLVILHFNKPDLTGACLESVKQLEVKNFKLEVVIVNNNPLEEIDFLKKRFPEFIFLEVKENLGFTGGNNFGLNRVLKDKVDFVYNGGNIEFKNACFDYSTHEKDDKKIILNEFNCVFEKGTKNAVVGYSGTGKSTLFNLIVNNILI